MSQDSKLATGDRAIHFWLKLSSGEASEADHAACRSWRAADPTHEHAWARLQQGLEQSLGRLEGVLKQEELRRTLIRPARRRVVLSLAGLAGAAGVGALLADRVAPLGNMLADLGTATAERRRVTLPDGSLLTLDARSRVDLHFSATTRTVHLLAGAVLAQPSPSSHPLFAVSTPHGRVQSAGAGYMVRLDEDSSLGVALQDGVDIVTRDVRRLTLAAGSGVRFGADWIGAPDPALAAAAAWQEGWLKAQDQALGEVVASLARYRKGVLRVSPEAARIPVSGLYPLDDTDRALSALAHTLPIRIRRLGPWLTLIDTRSA